MLNSHSKASVQFTDIVITVTVNLGIGMPMLAPMFVEPGTTIHMQSENGILGK